MKQIRIASQIGRCAARVLRIGLLALGFGAALALPAGTQAQGSDKFIPTFLVYYGGGPQLVAADAAKLAKFDLIDIDRFRYQDIGPNTWAAIKALNPAMQIYLYEMGPEAPSHLDSTLPLFLNGLGRYDVSRGHFMGSLNGNHPGLFLLNSAGQRVYSVGFSNVGANQYWHLMDFGDSSYQSYWINAVKADIVDQPWAADGVFVDNCLTLANAGGYSATNTRYPTNIAWSAAMNSFVEAISNGMRAYGQKLWCNRGETRSVDGSAAWLSLDNGASPPDVLLEEGAFAVEWGSDTQFYPELDWKRQIDTIAAIRNSKVATMSHTKLMDGQSGTDKGPAGELRADAVVRAGLVPARQERRAGQCLLHVQRRQRLQPDLVVRRVRQHRPGQSRRRLPRHFDRRRQHLLARVRERLCLRQSDRQQRRLARPAASRAAAGARHPRRAARVAAAGG